MRPYIYYIILDAFARPDIMLREVGFDVSCFVGFITGYLPTEQIDAGQFLTPDLGPADSADAQLRLNPFDMSGL